jgi:membrane protein implicated in regulation of membrane protease activity
MSDVFAFFPDHPFWAWMALAGVLLAIEVATGSGWMLWPAASAAVVAVLVSFVGVSLAPAVLIFAGLTIVSTLLARRYLPRSVFHHAGRDINDNVERLVGHEGRAVGAFKDRAGRVFIDGKEWAAELTDGEALEAGARVQVTSVDGARLTVRGA